LYASSHGISGLSPGLRERKKQKTRDTIIKVALGLFAERGYEQTTIAEIADAPRFRHGTIFAYFPSKEDILFCDLPESQERLALSSTERPEATALDALRRFHRAIAGSDDTVARKRILASDETLRRNERARFARSSRLMVEADRRRPERRPDDIRPRSSPPP